MDIDAMVEQARERVHLLIDNRHARARAELQAMVEASRRSIGQRFRFVIPAALRRFRMRNAYAAGLTDPDLRMNVDAVNLELYLQQSSEEAHGRGHPDGSR